jgi:hypothetical protein
MKDGGTIFLQDTPASLAEERESLVRFFRERDAFRDKLKVEQRALMEQVRLSKVRGKSAC